MKLGIEPEEEVRGSGACGEKEEATGREERRKRKRERERKDRVRDLEKKEKGPNP